MGKRKRKLPAAEKAAKKRRREEYLTFFIHGKQKRVRRPPTVEGIDVDEFIRRNADPVWLHRNEMWEYMDWPEKADRNDPDNESDLQESTDRARPPGDEGGDDFPF